MNGIMKKLVSHLLNDQIEEAGSKASMFPKEFGNKLLGDDGFLTEFGINEAFEYPFPQKLGKELIKCMNGLGSTSLIESEFAAYNKVFKLFEPKSTQLSQFAKIKAIASMSLKEQCKAISWPLTTNYARSIGQKAWATEFAEDLYPEEVVANTVLADGGRYSWCEGGSLNLMLKAAVLEVLAHRNFFNEREDAVSRYFEAQLSILTEYHSELIDCARKITDAEFQSHISEICIHPSTKKNYPHIQQDFLYALAKTIPVDLRVQLLQTYMLNPYAYRAGWPDLTVLRNGTISFIEVKTTDRLHESQIRFATEVATPLGLECQVVQVLPII